MPCEGAKIELITSVPLFAHCSKHVAAVAHAEDEDLRARPDEFFGEIVRLSHGPRTATVTSMTPTHRLVVTDQAFRPPLDNLPELQRRALRALAERPHSDSI